jgi:hypothetical protein
MRALYRRKNGRIDSRHSGCVAAFTCIAPASVHEHDQTSGCGHPEFVEKQLFLEGNTRTKSDYKRHLVAMSTTTGKEQAILRRDVYVLPILQGKKSQLG